jgi:hypothetical protein
VIAPAEVRAMVAAIEGANDTSDDAQLSFNMGDKGFAWSFKQRVTPKQPRVPQLDILAVRVPMVRKEFLIEVAPDRFFDDPHYRGYPAVLVRLEVVEADELASLLADAAKTVAEAKPRKPRKRA